MPKDGIVAASNLLKEIDKKYVGWFTVGVATVADETTLIVYYAKDKPECPETHEGFKVVCKCIKGVPKPAVT